MKLRYTAPALADLDALLDHIEVRSQQGATRVRARIHAIVTLLMSHPYTGVRTVDPTIRRINTSPYPYLIFYESTPDEIIIHAVRHGARDPSGMPGSAG